MHRYTRRLAPLALLGMSLGLAIACDSGTVNGNKLDGGGGDGLLWPDGAGQDGQGPSCTKNEQCKGGVCLAGHCCGSAAQVCGDLCCPGGTVCFANACVKPGKLCYSVGDCDPGQYCEPSLGPGAAKSDGGATKADGAARADGGVAPDGGKVCLAPPPTAGRCLDLPKRCPDGQPPPKDGSCLPACEFKPSVGNLETKQKWRWGEGSAQLYKNFVDVWSTPLIGRLTDTNCDGKVNELDPPNIVFVAGNAQGTCCSCGGFVPSTCHTGVLRVLDGATGQEIWSLRKASPQSVGFMGLTMALADFDRDGHLEIAAVTGEGYIVLIDRDGKVLRTSDKPIPEALDAAGAMQNGFGWGGGLAVADMDGDGFPEIAYGRSVFTTKDGKITFLFEGKRGRAGGITRCLSVFSDLNGDGKQELIVGNAAYKIDGTELWYNATSGDGYPAVADFDGDGKPEVAVVTGNGQLNILEGATGKLLAGPFLLPGTDNGGAPTVADFDGDGKPEVGVAKANFYSVTKVDLAAALPADKLETLWKQVNHDFSSSVTGSTVFDFEGDGSAEVIYNDECFLWVYDGKTGAVRYATPTNSFTGTEAALVADVDGDGRAEMVMMSNRASPAGWKCDIAPWTSPDPKLNRPAWAPPAGQTAWSGITVYGDKAGSWVGTRTLWNQHSYHVSNICDQRDSACQPNENQYGAIPRLEKTNWTVKWLNNFRQNVQDKGLFDAPDAAITLRVECTSGLEGQVKVMKLVGTLRNLGLALLPAAVKVGFFVRETAGDRLLVEVTTTSPLFPGQAVDLIYTTKAADNVSLNSTFVAKIIIDPNAKTFNECRTDNNESEPARNPCQLQ